MKKNKGTVEAINRCVWDQLAYGKMIRITVSLLGSYNFIVTLQIIWIPCVVGVRSLDLFRFTNVSVGFTRGYMDALFLRFSSILDKCFQFDVHCISMHYLFSHFHIQLNSYGCNSYPVRFRIYSNCFEKVHLRCLETLLLWLYTCSVSLAYSITGTCVSSLGLSATTPFAASYLLIKRM